MSYVPSVPGFTPVSYGQGYGDWQQYAGYNKDNPFGSAPALLPKSATQKPPAGSPIGVPPIQQQKPVDYSLAPQGQMGAAPKSQFGNYSANQLGKVPGLSDILKQDEIDYE